MSDRPDPRITALMVSLADSSPAAPSYEELEELRDATATHRRSAQLSPARGRPRAWALAVAAAATVLVAIGGVILWLAEDTPQTPVATITTTPWPSLPHLDSWQWQRVDGDRHSVPDISSLASVDGTLLAIECDFAATCQSIAWISDDGLIWARGSLPAALEQTAVYLVDLGEETWAFAGPDHTRAELLRLSGDDWVAVSLPDGPNGERPMARAWPAPVRSGDNFLVGGFYNETPVVWVSTDGGDTFRHTALPAPEWVPAALLARPNGFIVYGGIGRGDIEVLVSVDGDQWSPAGPAPFMEEAELLRETDPTELSIRLYQIDGTGPYFAVVATTMVADEIAISDTFEYWISEDGLAWKRGPGLSTQSPETGTFFTPRFGLVWIGFSGVSTPHDLVQTLVSADGLEWADLSDPDIYYPMERPPLDDVAGTMSWRMVDDLLIVSRTLAVGERTIWVGGFEE